MEVTLVCTLEFCGFSSQLRMIFKYILFATTLTSVTSGSSYQFLRFQKPSGPQAKTSKSAYLRSSRAHHGPDNNFRNNLDQVFHNNINHALQNNGIFLPPDNLFDFDRIPQDIQKLTYEISEVYDPNLLTGNAAKQAARYLYGRGQLFFGQYPHVKALLKNQDKRRANGLAGNRLGSLRTNSPFHRYGRPPYFSWYI